MPTTYRLDRSVKVAIERPPLDEAQQEVVDHPGGPLLVLAGPGTGKTTTLVEAVVERIESGLSPESVLVLTFSRKAAEQLRDRITGRLGRTVSSGVASTFHSFAYGLVRAHQPAELYRVPLRLLSAPEQDVRLRDLLTHSRESARADWPAALDEALSTRGFAREVHRVLARARERSLDPEDLARIGAETGRGEWIAAGAFMREYLDVLGFEGAIDYAELIHAAVRLAETPEVQRELRERFRSVFVDEYQDTDPSQVRLLQAIAGEGRDLIVVGDPDQSIYAFRGAEVRGILDFPARFPRADGRQAPVVALRTTRRFGDRLLTASRRVASRISAPGSIDKATFRAFRSPVAVPGPLGPGRAEVHTFSSSGSELDHIADLLRRAHLEDDVPWHEMAVLVRSGVRSIPGMRRALVTAGVPVEVAGDEVPLRDEPAVQPLLLALRAAVDPDELTADTARSLLLSPLGDLDAAALRKLGRGLRRRARTEDPDRLPPASADLLREALADPSYLDGMEEFLDAREGWLIAGPRTLAGLLHRSRLLLASGTAAEEALWALWDGTRWPRRLRGGVERGGAAARAAHRDLDAICALFDAAARAEEQHDHAGAGVFLAEVEAQQIPADTLADKGVRSDAVRLLTAHRSKGLEWRVVVVAGVQEGTWPDVRRRGSLLQADRLGSDGLVDPPTVAAMLAEERRLFYVAVTRARQRLIVTAVASPEGDGDQPSRLLHELALEPVHRAGRPERLMSLPGLVSELRRVASDPDRSTALQHAAAARLAALTAEEVGDRRLVPSADPDTWWGLRDLSVADVPVRPTDQPLRLSASALDGILTCPLRWFLSREAAGESARSTSLGFGSVIHALAEHMTDGEVGLDDLVALLDSVWDQLQFESRWVADRERAAAVEALGRFVEWHNGRPGRSYLAAEADFAVDVPLEGGETVALNGRVDRVERDDQGQVVVVDFKTSKNPPSDRSLADNPQLGVYQLAVERGGLSEVTGTEDRSGGAELVQLRIDKDGLPRVQVQEPQQPDEAGRTRVEVQLIDAARAVRGEAFPATLNQHCNFCEFTAMCPAQQRSGTVI